MSTLNFLHFYARNQLKISIYFFREHFQAGSTARHTLDPEGHFPTGDGQPHPVAEAGVGAKVSLEVSARTRMVQDPHMFEEGGESLAEEKAGRKEDLVEMVIAFFTALDGYSTAVMVYSLLLAISTETYLFN